MVIFAFSRSVSLLAAVLLTLPAPSLAGEPYPNTSFFGVPFSHDEEWYQLCMHAAHAAPPQGDLPASSAGKCDALDLYYDTLAQPTASGEDWKRVRACAYASNDQRVLMMLYANGFGVAKNPMLATRYACSLEYVAKAEMGYRVPHAAAAGQSGKAFDFCDDITSGASQGVCAQFAERQNEHRRMQKLASFEATLPESARTSLRALLEAARTYSTKIETDWQGTAAAALSIEATGKFMDRFVGDLHADAEGSTTEYSSARLAALETDLGRALQAALTKPSVDPSEPGRIGYCTITHDQIAQAQAAWAAYRDKWMSFLQVSALRADPVAIRAILTERRIAQLASLMRC